MAGRSRGSIVSRGKGIWGVIIPLGKDPETGKYKQKWYTVHGNKKDAEKFRTEKLRELDTHTLVEDTKVTVKDYLNKWLETYAKDNVSPRTYIDYQRIINCHLIPGLGKITLADLRPLDVQNLYTRLLQGDRKDGKPGGLSPRSVVYCHRILKEALSQAVRWEILPRNVAEAVEPPKAKRSPVKSMTREQVSIFLSHAKEHRLYPLFLTAIMTGMRQGELLGLRWQDVNFDKGTASVRQVLQVIHGKTVIKERPKNENSIRSVSLSPNLIPELKKIHQKQKADRLAAGDEYENNDLVFCQANGRPWNPRNVVREYDTLLKKAGLPHFRFHDLRHTFATLLLEEDVHPKVVSEMLGHAGITITLDTYSHVVPSLQRPAAEKMDKFIPKPE